MRLPEKEYYSLKEVADQWDCTIPDLLHYAETKKLEICVYVRNGAYEITEDQWCVCVHSAVDEITEDQWAAKGEPETKKVFFPGGPCPISMSSEGWRNIRIYGHPKMDIGVKHPKEKTYFFVALTESDYDISDLTVTHKEKLRFKKEYVLKKEMGTKERENLLRLIGALIEQNYQGVEYRKKNGVPNANAIVGKFHGWLTDNYFSAKGISDTKFRKLIPEAYNLILENKEEKTKISIKKISPT